MTEIREYTTPVVVGRCDKCDAPVSALVACDYVGILKAPVTVKRAWKRSCSHDDITVDLDRPLPSVEAHHFRVSDVWRRRLIVTGSTSVAADDE